MMKRKFMCVAVAGALLGGTAFAQSGAEIGVLTCTVTEIDNVVVYTKETFACEFKPANGEAEHCAGQIKKVGIDLS